MFFVNGLGTAELVLDKDKGVNVGLGEEDV
jgi:hypothetical protein